MKVREIMNSHIRQISSSAMVSEALERMRVLDAEILPVVENRQIIGTISSRDIADRMHAVGMDPGTTPVQNAMTRGAACCGEDDDIGQAARLLETSRARLLIVLDARGEAVGILSAEDLTSKVGEPSHTRSLIEGENHESPRY